VCIGTTMEKARVKGGAGALTLDHCARCGGVWFERGEVGQLANVTPAELWAQIAPLADPPRPPCHGCHAPLDRDAEKCAACGRRNDLSCPNCDQTLARRPHAGLVLDVCDRCHGVWFDNAELGAIWTQNFRKATEAAARRPGAGGEAMAIGGDVLLSAMIWTPGLVVDGAMGVAHLGGAAAEVVGGAAEGVFSTILEFIGGLFDS
jgi:Zn-finger nucleic acid-binding protein